MPSGRLQFFALEASDYLERLAIIVARREPPEPDELIRLTRALRGAALMAGLPVFARAAAALEHVAKSHRDDPTTWGPPRTELLASAVEELKRLTRNAAAWSEQDDAAATALARELLAGFGAEAPPVAQPPGDEVPPSVRTFIGREGASIAGTLEHAAQRLDLGQASEAAELVLPRLQPLRGLATLPNLSPLPEFLDAIELTVRSIRDQAPPPGGAHALRRAAAAVTCLAREIADHGRAGVDAPEVVVGAVSLLESFGREDDVVDVAALFRPGDPAPIVAPGNPPGADSPGDPTIELVSLADRFRQAADQLSAPTSSAGLTLYLYGLLVQLRPLTQAAPRERPHLKGLLSGISVAIGQGRAARAPRAFAEALREAASHVTRAAEARNAVFLEDELAGVLAALARLDGPIATGMPRVTPPVERRMEAVEVTAETEVPRATADDGLGPIVSIESLAPDEPAALEEVAPVPISSLAPDLPEDLPEPVPIASLAPDGPVAAGDRPGPSPFELSFSTYRRLVEDEAARRPPAIPGIQPATNPEVDVVSISTLLFRGRRALERADTVRLALSDALKSHRTFEELEPLVSELIDLVPLALEE